MDPNKKKAVIIVGVCAAGAVCAAAIWAMPTIRQMASVARSASMDEGERTAIAEENAQLEEEIRERYSIPDLTVSDDISAALEDGSTTLEEAAQRLLEESGGFLEEIGGASGAGGSAVQVTPPREQTAPEEPRPQDTQDQTPVQDQTPAPQPSQQTEEPSQTREDPVPQEEPSQTQEDPAPQEEPQISETDKKIQNLVAQMYVLRSSFTSRLDATIAECIAEFLALDPEQQTTANKVKIVSARLGTVADMEKECDDQVASIVAQIRELDPDLADQMQQQYENEKAVKKADLIAQYTG